MSVIYYHTFRKSAFALIVVSSILIGRSSAGAASNYSGMLDTSVYTYSTVKEDLSGTETNYRLYESVLFDFKFNDKISFHTNDRVVYKGLEAKKDENADPSKLDLNIYYTYFDLKITDSFGFQAGRIMDINNLIYSYYDGINLFYKKKIEDKKISFNFYGGLLVNDDYLEDEKKIYGYNSFDPRNFYTQQRKGDYLGGTKFNFFSNKIGSLTLDYQMTMNDSKAAEQYASIDFDSMFSKIIKLYGYGTFDIIEKKPSSGLGGVRVTPFELISVSVEYEYYRPVYIKDSFFWTFFNPYGHHAVSGSILFFFSPIITLDIKYSRIIYEGANEQGDEATVSLEDRKILGFGVLLTGSALKSPMGDKYTGLGIIKRRFFNVIDINAGGGVVYFNEDPAVSVLSKAYVARGGLGIRIYKLIISGDAEYFNNPKYTYDIRALVSAKYIF